MIKFNYRWLIFASYVLLCDFSFNFYLVSIPLGNHVSLLQTSTNRIVGKGADAVSYDGGRLYNLGVSAFMLYSSRFSLTRSADRLRSKDWAIG